MMSGRRNDTDTGRTDFDVVDRYVSELEDASGMPELIAATFAPRCYIDRCGESATYVVHSYPDTVRLCAAHKSLHPVEPHETRCVGASCHLCERSS